MAENFVKDKRYEENSEATQVFMDKNAYKAAEKERKELRKQLIDRYRNEGLSRKEAKQKADAQLVENEYVKGKKTRKFVEANQDMFYDDNGNFSSDKFKQTALKFANTHTQEGEAENHYLSLKERREVAEEQNVKAKVIKNIVKKSNLGYERDNTNLYRGLYVAGVTGVGAGLGAALGATGLLAGEVVATATSNASATATATANVYDEAGNVIASSTETATSNATDTATAKGKSGLSTAAQGAKAGSLLGLGIGLATMGFIKDKGNKEAKIYTPGKEEDVVQPQPQQPAPEPDPEPAPSQPEVQPCPLTPGEEREEYCDYKVQKGEYWRGIVRAKYTHEDGSKLTPQEEIEIVHELKRKHGITDFSANTQPSVMRLYTEINGKKYNINCDAAVKEKTNKFAPAKKYTGKAADGTVRYFYTDCEGNRSQFFKTKEERDAAMQANQRPQKAA